jgi:hypothetical protein
MDISIELEEYIRAERELEEEMLKQYQTNPLYENGRDGFITASRGKINAFAQIERKIERLKSEISLDLEDERK